MNLPRPVSSCSGRLAPMFGVALLAASAGSAIAIEPQSVLRVASDRAGCASHGCGVGGTRVSGLTPILDEVSTRAIERAARERIEFSSIPAWELVERQPRPPLLPELYIACFDPANPPSEERMAEFENILFNFQQFFQPGNGWLAGSNNPVSLTWSLVPDTVFVPSGVGEAAANSNLFANFNSRFGGNTQQWISILERALQRNAALCGVTLTRVRNGNNQWDDGASWGSAGGATRGDIRIAAKNIDGANGVLAYNAFPPSGDMVLDSSEGWQSSSSDFIFLRNVTSHENGHGLGFFHVCPTNRTKLMEPFYSSAYDGPQQDDIRGLQTLYGDVNEPNGSTSQSVDLGTLGTSGSVTVGTVPPASSTSGFPAPANSSLVSIATNPSGTAGDQDFFRIRVDTPRLINVTLAPVGSTYDDNPQCSSGVTTDALRIADLSFTIIASDRSTQLGTFDANGLGVSETANGAVLWPAGEYYIRIETTSAHSEAQLYRLTVASSSTPSMSASDNTFPDRVRVSWTAVPGVAGYDVLRATANVTNPASATIVGSVGYSGGTPPTTFEDTTVPGGTVFNYWIRAGYALDGGGFRYQVVNGPEQGSRPAVCPTITRQPESASACEGATVTLTVGAFSQPAPAFRWQKNGVQISNVTTSTLTLTNVTAADAGVYTATATNSCGTATSNPATVLIGAPTITAQPVSASVDVGQPASFSVAASGPAPITYQWSKDGNEISGATNSTYSIAAATASDAGLYTVVVSNTCGDTTSQDATLTVAGQCAADFNGDGTPDFFDYLDFASQYAAEDPAADFNDDGSVDFFDYLDFASAFDAGC